MNEREFEDIICKYPELIETGLKVKGRQVTVKGKRIDVLFEDRHGQDLIVEIKKGTVIRDHCSQLFDYEGYFVSSDNPNVRVMLVGNRVPENLRRSLNHHGFEWKELTIKTLINFLSTKCDSALLQCLSSEEPLTLGINFPDQDKMIFEKHNLPLSLPEADNFRFVGSKRVDDFKTTFWNEFSSYLKRSNHEWVNGSKVMRGYIFSTPEVKRKIDVNVFASMGRGSIMRVEIISDRDHDKLLSKKLHAKINEIEGFIKDKVYLDAEGAKTRLFVKRAYNADVVSRDSEMRMDYFKWIESNIVKLRKVVEQYI